MHQQNKYISQFLFGASRVNIIRNQILLKHSVFNFSGSSNKPQKPLNILMLGAPGVGKGTYGRFMKKDFNLPVLSSGDELRKVLASTEGEKLAELKNILREGKLAGDEFMFNFMKERLLNPECLHGVILDGYPRNPKQANEIEKLLSINLVIKIDLNEDILIQKLLGRRVCKGCGKNYNVYSIYNDKYELDPLPPKNHPDKCDECNSSLYQRDDDNLETIKDRLEIYNTMTKPLEKYYEDKNILHSFEMRRGVKDYYLIKDFITEWKKKNNYL